MLYNFILLGGLAAPFFLYLLKMDLPPDTLLWNHVMMFTVLIAFGAALLFWPLLILAKKLTGLIRCQSEYNQRNALLYAKAQENACTDPICAAGAVSQSGDGLESVQTTVYALTAAIDAKDHFTFTHSLNVAKYASALAKELGLDAVHQQMIYEAGLLHDVGKIGIPERILTKADRLTGEEYGIIKRHVDISINIVKHLPSMTQVIPAIVGHHERWDGKGYPRGIVGNKIPIEARCLSIADTFDAITSARPYKKPCDIGFALAELERGAGTQLDPSAAPAFVRMIREGRLDVTPMIHV